MKRWGPWDSELRIDYPLTPIPNSALCILNFTLRTMWVIDSDFLWDFNLSFLIGDLLLLTLFPKSILYHFKNKILKKIINTGKKWKKIYFLLVWHFCLQLYSLNMSVYLRDQMFLWTHTHLIFLNSWWLFFLLGVLMLSMWKKDSIILDI